MPYTRAARDNSSVLSSRKESSAQAASASRIRRAAPPWLGLATTAGLDEDTAHRQRIQEIEYGLPFLDANAGVPGFRAPDELRHAALEPLDDWVRQRAAEVSASPEELAGAEGRASAVVAALAVIYPGAEVYRTGSITHGDALSPLNDVDLGVILRDRPDLGPGPGQTGPQDEMRQTAARLESLLRDQFPRLTADPGNKRSIVLEFNDPETPGEPDFTCDVIIAIGAESGPLLIPNTELRSGWDENDPVGHVDRLRRAERTSGGSYSQTVRLGKHWRNSQDPKPLYSWNIKTLALEAGDGSTLPFEGLYRFFEHAVHAVAEGPTENPGSQNFPPPTVATDRLTVTRQLMDALATLDRARMYALEGESGRGRAVAELERFFPDPGR